jgi:VWFA-related protein
MASRREFTTLLLGAPLLAQQQGQQPEQSQEPLIRATVDVVIAPVTVLDGNENLVSGLQPHDFRLFDNGKEQNIQVDVSYVPISLVIIIQASANTETVLKQVRNIGSLIQPLVIGDAGEAGVLAFDHRMRTMTDFTSDADKIGKAVEKITAGSQTHALNDAVREASRMLRTRPSNRRRIILLIAQTRDYGSQARAREVLSELQLHNILLYSVNMSRFITTLTGKPEPPRPDPMPPAARPLPPNVPATPNTVMQTYGSRGYAVQFVPLFVEIFKSTKAIFVDNPMEVYTKATGGKEFSFVRQQGLEDAINQIGTELHSQYLITYNPNNKDEGGFHEIHVQIIGRRDLTTRTRPGYYLGVR